MTERDEKTNLNMTANGRTGHYENHAESDELDIFATFGLLAKHAAKIKLATLISIALMTFFVGMYLNKTAKARYFRYQMEIGLNFDGINNKLYPDGKIFNPNDIISADVLKTIYDKLKLEPVSFKDFVNSFSSSYKTVRMLPQAILPAITKEKDEDKKKEVKVIKPQITEVINPSEILINMDVHSNTQSLKQLEGNVLASIFNDVPVVWSKKFNNQYLKLNIPNPLKVVSFEELTSMGYAEIYDILTKNLKRFSEVVNETKSTNINLSNVRSEKHDLTLDEAFFYVQDSLPRKLNAWYAVPQRFGIYKDKGKRKDYLAKRFFELSEKRKILVSTTEGLRQTLEAIRNPDKSLGSLGGKMATKDKRSGSKTGGDDSEVPVYDNSLLELIYDSGRANQNISVQYVQDLTDKYLKGIENMATLEFEISKVNLDLKNISKKITDSEKSRKSIANKIDQDLEILIEEYQKWINICIDIAAENVKTESMKTGGVYTVVSPMRKIHVNPASSKALMKKWVIIPGFLVVLGFFGYCISLILREGFYKYRKEQEKI